MIKILLSGCLGKMGKVITACADNMPELKIVAGYDRSDIPDYQFPVYSNLNDCKEEIDVIIDFSRPDALNSLLNFAKNKNAAIILCTTGYTEENKLTISEASKEVPVFFSANMSIGINVVNNLLKNISKFLYEDFDIEIIEKHHNQKVDAPSGTALLLADTIRDSLDEQVLYVHGRSGISKRQEKEIGIHAVRGGNIVGDHSVIFAGSGEVIEINHFAMSKDVFAVGSLKAAKFMAGKSVGMYSMDDMIQMK